MLQLNDMLFVGVKSTVLAVNRNNGEIVWQSGGLGGGMGGSFVNVFFDGEGLFAHSGGELYRLDVATGRVLWRNPLTGFGYGIATFGSPNCPAGNLAAIMRKMDDDARSQQAATT